MSALLLVSVVPSEVIGMILGLKALYVVRDLQLPLSSLRSVLKQNERSECTSELIPIDNTNIVRD